MKRIRGQLQTKLQLPTQWRSNKYNVAFSSVSLFLPPEEKPSMCVLLYSCGGEQRAGRGFEPWVGWWLIYQACSFRASFLAANRRRLISVKQDDVHFTWLRAEIAVLVSKSVYLQCAAFSAFSNYWYNVLYVLCFWVTASISDLFIDSDRSDEEEKSFLNIIINSRPPLFAV